MRPIQIIAAALFFTALSLASLSGCGLFAKEDPRPNIVLIIIDTLRKDHVSCYGYERKTTPFIDSLAQGGLVFENAVSQAPWTFPSTASISTSKYPSQLMMASMEYESGPGETAYAKALSHKAVTLADVLGQRGYRTMIVSANLHISGRFGMFQGFDEVSYESVDAAALADKAAALIEEAPENAAGEGAGPFFMHLHFNDVHAPNDPPPPYDSLYPTLDGAPHGDRHAGWDFVDAEGLDTLRFREYKSHKTALYDGSITFVDSQIERFAGFLKQKGLYENTVIVIASDHGEELWDHALFEKEHAMGYKDTFGIKHGHTLFRELIDVPLVFHGKDVPAGRITAQVNNIDIMPTLLGLAGINEKQAGTDMLGLDLAGLLRKGELKSMRAYSEFGGNLTTLCSLQDDSYKYFRYHNKEFLFDKKLDPLESMDISKENPRIMDGMRGMLERIQGSLKPVGAGRDVVLDKVSLEELRALGYIQ